MVANTRRNSSFVIGDGKDIDLNGRFILGPEQPHLVKKAASANVRNSHDVEVGGNIGAAYSKVKTIIIGNGLKGSARFLFDLRSVDAPSAGYGKIYRNGIALGTEQSNVSGVYETKSEDITQEWAPGDTCELWIHAIDGVKQVLVKNFRIAYDDAPTVAVASTNS